MYIRRKIQSENPFFRRRTSCFLILPRTCVWRGDCCSLLSNRVGLAATQVCGGAYEVCTGFIWAPACELALLSTSLWCGF